MLVVPVGSKAKAIFGCLYSWPIFLKSKTHWVIQCQKESFIFTGVYNVS